MRPKIARLCVSCVGETIMRKAPDQAMRVAARYGSCDIAVEANDNGMKRWKEKFARESLPSFADTRACGPIFCNLYENLYFYDRCWNPRFACAITVGSGSASSTLVVSQQAAEVPAYRSLQAGSYFTVLGPAAAFGVGATVGFADLLRARFRMPVVNLGRGGAGPSLYLNAETERVTELMAQSRAVIIVLMAGRSSANSAFPLGVDAMARAAGTMRIFQSNPARGRQLMNESLTTAASEYATLAARIRGHAKRLDVTPPEILLMWFSECDLAEGCGHPGSYPQFFTAGTDAVVRNIARRIGARLVDASYGHVSPPTPMSLGQCPACTPRLLGGGGRRASCTMDEARAEMNAPSMRQKGPNGTWQAAFGDSSYRNEAPLQGCTRTCAAVVTGYYPHDSAHQHAAHVLQRELHAVLNRPARRPAQPSVEGEESRPHVRGGLLSHPLLPRIDVSKKVFFSHVHKCAGTAFTTFLQRQAGVSWCESLVASDLVRPSSERALTDWWFDGMPNCSLLALEVPTLGELVVSMRVEREARAAAAASRVDGDAPLPVDFYEPQTAIVYRDPFDRCRSEWRYEQSICHPPGGLQTMPAHTVAYCRDWFLPRYGSRLNSSSVHQAFVREYCTERLSKDLERHDVSFGELAQSDRLLYVGVAEDYFAATCLFWYQAGRFPREQCSCDAVNQASRRGNDEELSLRGLKRSWPTSAGFARLGLPDLRLSREAFERRNPGDVALYRVARHLFDTRVRLVERRVGQRFSGCDMNG